MFNATVKSDVKSHIVETALALFNEKGFGATTTAAIAEATGKTVGNLWYHYRTKGDLLDAVLDLAIERFEQRIAMRPLYGENILHEYAKMLRFFAKELRDFRFIYRDQSDYGKAAAKILDVTPRIYKETLAQFDLYFNAMIKETYLANNPERIAVLMQASIIIIRYNLEIRRERGIENEPGSGAIQDAFEFHLKLFEPLLTPEAVNILRAELSDQSA